MPAAADKPLGADTSRPLPNVDEDDDDDELIDDDEDAEETLAQGVHSSLTDPPPLTTAMATATLLHHHNNDPALAGVGVGDDEEDLPTSSSSSAAEEDDNDNEALHHDRQLILPLSSAATNNPNPNILALPNPFNNGSGTLLSTAMVPADPSHLLDTPSPKRLRADDVKPTPTPPPSDDSRRLFQRLWTDDDEIELLQGFLEFNGQRSSNHHLDTTVFYDSIKTKLQVDFNKNQLVEKLRRLKKKYRNALNRINSSKDFAFKSPHEQATFDISSQIWNSAASLRAQIPTANVDDANTTTNVNEDSNTLLHNNGGVRLTTRKRTRATRSTVPDGGGLSPAAAAAAAAMGGGGAAAAGAGTAAASVVMDQYQQQHPSVVVAGYSPLHHPPHTILAPPNPVSAALPMSLIEDTVRSCLSPLFKELLQCAVTTSGAPTPHGFMGGGMPLPQFMGWSLGGGGGPAAAATTIGAGGGLMNHSESMDERLRRQQILELEVYSKRLELVQEQIKVALEDLKSKGG